MRAGVLERFVHGQIRVLELDVLSDERDLHFVGRLLQPLGQVEPFAELRLARRQAELVAHEAVETFCLQP